MARRWDGLKSLIIPSTGHYHYNERISKMDDWTEVEDVINRWVENPPDSDDVTLITFIEDAEQIIKEAFPNIADRVTSGELSIKTIKRVVSSMVQRAYALSGMYAGSTLETAGSFTRQESYSIPIDDRGLGLTTKEYNALSSKKRLVTTMEITGSGFCHNPVFWG